MHFPPERQGRFTEGGKARPQPASRDPSSAAVRLGRFIAPTRKPKPQAAASPDHADLPAWHPGSGEVVPVPAGSYLTPDEQAAMQDLPPLEEE